MSVDRPMGNTHHRLFTVPYFSVRSQLSIIELDKQPSWSSDASKTGESTKYLWVEVVEGQQAKKIELDKDKACSTDAYIAWNLLILVQNIFGRREAFHLKIELVELIQSLMMLSRGTITRQICMIKNSQGSFHPFPLPKQNFDR